MAASQTYVRLASGLLTQYLEVREKEWVLRQSFGYPLLIAPFERLGVPSIVNTLLAISSLWLTYLVLHHWFTTHIATIGTVFLAWTPMTLFATHLNIWVFFPQKHS